MKSSTNFFKMMRVFSLLMLLFLTISLANASNEGEFIKRHANAFYILDNVAKVFESKLLVVSSKDTALKYIDRYSVALESALAVYSKKNKADSKILKKVKIDLNKMLSDIRGNNYQLLGKLVKSDLTQEQLKRECKMLVDKNKYISSFLRDVSIGICMITVEDKAGKVSNGEQVSKLNRIEKDDINKLLVDKFGGDIIKAKKENARTPYEYSCVAIYEFLNMNWSFQN